MRSADCFGANPPNVGTNPSNKLNVTLSNSTFFELSENLCSNITLAANAECTLKVKFKGSVAITGSKTATLIGGSYNSFTDILNLSGVISSTDPCLGSPSIGTKCLGCNVIYAGVISGNDYYVTQSGCSNNANDTSVFTPTCSGTVDSISKTWDQGSVGASVNVTTLPDNPNPDTNMGSFNTDKMDAMTQPHKGAKYCQNMSLGGFTDWFLPNRHELDHLYQNRDQIEGFQTSSPTYYWSSTEMSTTSAIRLNFSNGTIDSNVKTSSYLVRCMRSADCFGANPPNVGTICTDGSIYAGTLDGYRYFTTKGNCALPASYDYKSLFTPSCNGSVDTLELAFNTGSNGDIYPLEAHTSQNCPIVTTEKSGVYQGPIAADVGVDYLAPRYCRNMVYGNKVDWFLPSIRERMMLDTNKNSIQGMISGMYDTMSYLSTSQQDNTRVWYYLCGAAGANTRYSKSTAGHIRCLRRWNPSDPCESKTDPSVGVTCLGGPKYAGKLTVGGATARYMVTPGGCSTSSNIQAQFEPTCSGGNDTRAEQWARNTRTPALVNPGSNADTKSGDYNTDIVDLDDDLAASAINFCNKMVYGGYSDWFLPNNEELDMLYQNKASLGGFLSTGPSPSYTDGAYWSSSMVSMTNAWSVRFSNGTKVSSAKNTNQYIRCVRRY